MDRWNKGGYSREEFLHMRENAMRQLQELARRQQPFPKAAPPGKEPQREKPITPPTSKEMRPPADLPAMPKTENDTMRQPFAPLLPPDSPVNKPEPETLVAPPEARSAQGEPQEPPAYADPQKKNPQTEQPMAFSPAILAFPPSAMEPLREESAGTEQESSAQLLNSLQNISRTIENIGLSFAGQPEATKAAALEAIQADPKPEAPDGSPERFWQTDFLQPPQPQEGGSPPADPWRQQQQEPSVMPHPPYHPDGFVPGKPEKEPMFHPDAVTLPEERYQPPAPPQKPPYQRRSFWGGESPKKK
ncbi:MAG: hypothetical protein PHE47_02145 [Oscillospiraceae bacterium]|nr:hypothetical protein [Oscillospiraceae bacterium]